jgi:hypothetical protein
MKRRAYVTTGGAIVATCLAGCLGGGSGDDGGSDDGDAGDNGDAVDDEDAGDNGDATDDGETGDGDDGETGNGDDGVPGVIEGNGNEVPGNEGDDGGPGDVEDRVEAFVAAIDDGDEERVNGMLAREGETDPWTLGEQARMEGFGLEVTEIERLEESGDRITVAVTVRITGQSEFSTTETTEYELRAIDGEWKVWDITVRTPSP